MKNLFSFIVAISLLSGAGWVQRETNTLVKRETSSQDKHKTATFAKHETATQGKQENHSPDVQKALGQLEHSEYFIRYQQTDKTLQSPNRAVNMRFTYKPGGFEVEPRVDSSVQWGIAFKLQGIYRGNQQILGVHDKTTEKLSDDHLIFEQNGYLVEYLNGKDGMRQNFIVAEKPGGSEPLTVKMKVESCNLQLACSNNELTGTQGGIIHYYYKDLKVYDANQKPLSASMQLQGNTLALIVDDRAAAYPITIDPISTTAAARVESDQERAYLGYSVASAGDVNGDGYGDVIVGAYGYDNGQTLEGAAFVYHGSPSGISATPAARVESDQEFTWFGYSVAYAGDVNGDGYGDVIMGAHYYDNGQLWEGAAFVYHGSPAGIITTAAARVESNQAGAWFGYSVASAGDVNGDGYSDVIVGTVRYDNGQSDEGAAFVYHGSAAGISTTAAIRLESDQANANFGISVASAGDVNGDGYSDVIVGAPYYDNGQWYEGVAFVYHGSAAGISATAAARVESDQVGAQLGSSVASAGDVNGDGYSDVIVGALGYSNGQSSKGAAFVYHGSATGISATAAARLESDNWDSNMGSSVASAGDVNGDGYSDVIVGASDYSIWQSSEGAAFVYHGSATGISATAAARLESDDYWDSNMGSSVASAGDVNGDGHSDVIVGAPYYRNGQFNEGAAYVFHGSADCTTEVCDGIDNNCNGTIDEGFPDTDNDGLADCIDIDSDEDGIEDYIDCAPNDPTKGLIGNFYIDFDGDGYHSAVAEVCYGDEEDLENFYRSFTNGPDCDDNCIWAHTSETMYVDYDGDGYHSMIVEECDQGCNEDGVPEYFYYAVYSTLGEDCDDRNITINVATTTWYKDADFDGYGDGTTVLQCTEPYGYNLASNLTAISGDCNDADRWVNPGATEFCYNGEDDNCNGLIDECWYLDADKDGYGNMNKLVYAATKPKNHVANADDCKDWIREINPGAAELCDGIDNNCDGQVDEGCANLRTWYRDGDGDGYGNPLYIKMSSIKPFGWVDNDDDCKDWNANVYPGHGCPLPTIVSGIGTSNTQPKAMVEIASEINVFPNPTRDEFKVTLNGFETGKKLEMQLMQADGKAVMGQSLIPSVPNQQVRLDVSRISSGYYLLLVKQGAIRQTKKVMIVR